MKLFNSFNSFQFYFRQWKEKFNLVDNEENDTLTYHYKQTYIFRPDLSGPGLTGDELIVIPHPSKHEDFIVLKWQPTFVLLLTRVKIISYSGCRRFVSGEY